jgi:LysM repeat protein
MNKKWLYVIFVVSLIVVPVAAFAIYQNIKPPTFTIPYWVLEGDTCTGLARKYNTTVKGIIELNDLNSKCDIMANRLLLLPLPAPDLIFNKTLTPEEKAFYIARLSCSTWIYAGEIEMPKNIKTILTTYKEAMNLRDEYNSTKLPADTEVWHVEIAGQWSQDPLTVNLGWNRCRVVIIAKDWHVDGTSHWHERIK